MSFLQNHCLDLEETMLDVVKQSSISRLSYLLSKAGCSFHDLEKRFISDSTVRLVAMGGLSIHELSNFGLCPIKAAELSSKTMGLSASMSYLSLPSGSALGSYNKVIGQGHNSIAHTTSITIFVGGISCGVENEFNSQRDLVHLSRITVARTAIQSCPPIVVLDPSLLSVYQEIISLIDSRQSLLKSTDKDKMEAINLLYPAAKASAFLMTGSLRNFQKLLMSRTDPGKEHEFRIILSKINNLLAILWPELFKQ